MHATRTLSSRRSVKFATRISDFDRLTASPGQMDHLISLCPTRQAAYYCVPFVRVFRIISRAREMQSAGEKYRFTGTRIAHKRGGQQKPNLYFATPASLYLLENNLSSFTGV